MKNIILLHVATIRPMIPTLDPNLTDNLTLDPNLTITHLRAQVSVNDLQMELVTYMLHLKY